VFVPQQGAFGTLAVELEGHIMMLFAPPAGDHTLAGTRGIIEQHTATGTQMRK
jgi:hypothetical protein